MTNQYLQYEIDSEGIATITINQVNQPANLFSFDFIKTYLETALAAVADENVKGVVVTSGRKIFMAGADLRELNRTVDDKEALFKQMMEMHKNFRAIETGGKPFVAAINGTALGGGLELCLTCHHRIVVNHNRIKIGFPEAKVGLLPGGGGTVKAPYLMGIQNALMNLMQGKELRPMKAKGLNLVDAVVENEETLIPAAKKWIKENPNPIQPWDDKGHKIPGGGLMSPMGAQVMIGGIGNLRKMAHGNYPAQQYIMSIIHDGLQVKFDRALEIEARYFIKAMTSKEAKNMIRTGFMAIQEAAKGKSKPEGYGRQEVKKLGILGAGMMGAGIAFVSATAGIDVVLKDTSVENAEKGKSYSNKLLAKRVSKGYMSQEKADALLGKIKTSDNPQDVKDCDLVIEAVFENMDLKYKVTKETEAVLAPDNIYASNTSTIPISLLAKASERPHNFIGIHFFSPVDKMPLVEIIVGKETNDRTIAAAVDYVTQIKKVPIVVNDSRGFFTSRCFGTYTSEGLFLLEEGVPAAMIENIAKRVGMPVGPLAVTDEVTLTLALHILESDPDTQNSPVRKRSYDLYKMLVNKHGRTSKKDGAGFYDYPKGQKKKLWSKLGEIFNSDINTLDQKTIEKRILHRQALESYRCLEEGVLRSVTDGDIGSVLGWGFPIYTGGALSYIDYVGMDTFIADCDVFTEKFGERFAVPQSLRNLMEEGKSVFEFRESSLNGCRKY